MRSGTSGGTRGSAPKDAMGSVGASARIAKTTKLMTMSVGTAMRSRRRMYLLNGPSRLSGTGAGSAVECFHGATLPVPSSCPLLGPVRDLVHLRVPACRNDVLQGL